MMQEPTRGVMVRLFEEPHDPTGLADVLIGSIGLTGAITLLALVMGALLAGVLFWFRRNRSNVTEAPRLSPSSVPPDTSESR